jgi:hypothetical protein
MPWGAELLGGATLVKVALGVDVTAENLIPWERAYFSISDPE